MVSPIGPRLEREPDDRPPVTLPRGRVAFAVALGLAPGLGLSAGLWPLTSLAVALGVLVVGVLLVRLDWAVLVVVAAGAFAGYLDQLAAWVWPGLLVVMAAAWVVRRGRGRLHDSPPNPVLVAAAALLAVVVLSRLLHDNGPSGDADFLRYLLYLVALMVLTDSLRGGVVPPPVVARVFVASCCVAGIVGIAGLATYVVSFERVGGSLNGPDELGFFLVAAVPLAFGLRSGARRTWPYDVALAILLVSGVGTLSRGALVGLAALVLFALAARMITPRTAALIAVSLGTSAAFLLAVAQFTGVSLVQPQDVAEDLSQRLQLWQGASEMTVDHPILGVGPGGLAQLWQDYRPNGAVADVVAGGAQSTYLGVATELGLLGLAALLGVLTTALLAAGRGWRASGDPLTAAVACALVGALVAALFVCEQLSLPLWLLAALAAALVPPGPEPDASASLIRLSGARETAQ